MLLDWDWFRQEVGQVWEHPKESLAPQGRIEEMQPGSSQRSMAGGREAAAQAETREAQAGATRTTQRWSQGCLHPWGLHALIA